MENKLIVFRKDGRIMTALSENGKICELFCCEEDGSLLGNIYIGRVQNVVKNINAAFIEIEKGFPCYYPLDDCEHPIFTKKIASNSIVAGDELLVQVKREAVKTKPPTLTSNLNFTGKYLVLTSGKKQLGISTKLDSETRNRLKEMMVPLTEEEFGFIVRTNAGNAREEEILQEAAKLKERFLEMKEKAAFRSSFTKMYETPASWLLELRDIRSGHFRILTDDAVLYEKMLQYLEEHQPEDVSKLELYQDTLLPLEKLYSIERELKNALSERVWMKSGAYLVIQPTEALTVIDVNTGKFEGKKKQQDTFLKINLEAAGEIARQLRLRNLSGIIVVDFINMNRKEDKETLMNALQEMLYKDPMKATVVDMTALNLVEITRKKVRKPLMEQMLKK